MQIRCKSCNQIISDNDVDPKTSIANCSSCNSIYYFKGKDDKIKYTALPKGIKIKIQKGHLEIVYRWFKLIKTIFLTIFSIVWNVKLVSLMLGMKFDLDKINFDQDLLLILPVAFIPLTLLFGGALVTYYTLCLWINKSIIQINDKELKINHSPLFWPGKKVIPIVDIDQVYCREICLELGDSRRTSYEVHLKKKNDSHLKLLMGLEKGKQALYIEQEIEKSLNIKNVRMEGEHRKLGT